MRKSPNEREKAHDTHRKAATKHRRSISSRKISVENGRRSHHTAALTAGSDQKSDTNPFIRRSIRGDSWSQVPAPLRDLAEPNSSDPRDL